MRFVGTILVIFYRDNIDLNLRNFFNGFFQRVARLKDGVFWKVPISVLGTVVAWLNGVMELQQTLLTIATALNGFFLRSAQTPEMIKTIVIFGLDERHLRDYR